MGRKKQGNRRSAAARCGLNRCAAVLAIFGLYGAAASIGASGAAAASNRRLLQDEQPVTTNTTVDPKPGKREVCADTCKLARNGVCEEGRPAKGGTTGLNTIYMVYCDLGTDCEDCGPWHTSAAPGAVPWESGGTPGPVTMLRAKDLQVRVRAPMMPQEHGFVFAYTDPSKDFGISVSMQHNSVVEPAISQIFYKIFYGRCVKPDGSRQLFVDVGANFGWFSVMAAAMGCRVIAFEPVPHFRAFLEYSVWLNDLQGLVDIRTNVVNNDHGTKVKFIVPARGNWGTAGIAGANIDQAIESSKDELELDAVKLQEMVKEDVLLMKIDVEGFEPYVIKGAETLLRAQKVDNIIMEYSPGVPMRARNFEMLRDTPSMLINLINLGYRIGHIGGGEGAMSPVWGGELKQLREATLGNLQYDIRDAEVWALGSPLGCPPVEDLARFEVWRGCGSIPEDLSPRSLGSCIEHNTNLWLSKSTELLRLNGTVGIVDLTAPPTQYFSTHIQRESDERQNAMLGQGNRWCHELDPQFQVRHRCPCLNKDVCGEEEQAVEAAASALKIPTNYIITADDAAATSQ